MNIMRLSISQLGFPRSDCLPRGIADCINDDGHGGRPVFARDRELRKFSPKVKSLGSLESDIAIGYLVLARFQECTPTRITLCSPRFGIRCLRVASISLANGG